MSTQHGNQLFHSHTLTLSPHRGTPAPIVASVRSVLLIGPNPTPAAGGLRQQQWKHSSQRRSLVLVPANNHLLLPDIRVPYPDSQSLALYRIHAHPSTLPIQLTTQHYHLACPCSKTPVSRIPSAEWHSPAISACLEAVQAFRGSSGNISNNSTTTTNLLPRDLSARHTTTGPLTTAASTLHTLPQS
jgi:hypothetical protein